MKKVLLALILVLSYPHPSYALECDIVFSGSGSSSYNGTYVDTGTPFRGEPQWVKTGSSESLGINSVSYDPAMLYWMFSPNTSQDANAYYIVYASGPEGSYTEAGAGTPPGGTAAFDCGASPSPSPSATSTATSTTEILYADFMLVSGIIIFLLSFVTWGFFFSPFKTKK